jgi:hypothetical protein
MTKIPSIIKNYRSNETEIPTFQYRVEQIITQHLKPSRMLDIIFSEITMFYYSFFLGGKNHYQYPVMYEHTPIIKIRVLLLFT